MLFSFNKYYSISKYNKIYLNLNKSKNVLMVSTFDKKNYFRSLLLYINLLYSMLSTPIDTNFFYLGRFISIYYGRSHTSFYFKKNIIK